MLPAGLVVLPDGLTSSAGNCAANTDRTRVDCDFGTLPAGTGSLRTVVIRALIPAGTAAGSSLTNTATLTSPTADPSPDDRTASATTTVGTSADLSISKAPVNDPPEAGNQQGYVLSVNNAGPSIARGVVVTDPLPAGTSYVGATDQHRQLHLRGRNVVTCDVGDVAAGAVADRPDQRARWIRVSAAARWSTPPAWRRRRPPAAPPPTPTRHQQLLDGQPTGRIPVRHHPGQADHQRADRRRREGDLPVTVGNSGPSDARNMLLTDPVPVGTTLVSATASADGTCQPATVVTCTWPLVPPAPAGPSPLVIAVAARPRAVGSIITNTASTRSDSFDNNPATASATATGR